MIIDLVDLGDLELSATFKELKNWEDQKLFQSMVRATSVETIFLLKK